MMGLYNFQKRFVPMIVAGRKTHTIRAPRKHPDRPGNILYLYTGLRQTGARQLKRPGSTAAVCVRVESIEITARNAVSIDGARLATDECNALARSDGFENFADMMRFWDGRRPFKGHVIHWEWK